jgi:hypothetical protein
LALAFIGTPDEATLICLPFRDSRLISGLPSAEALGLEMPALRACSFTAVDAGEKPREF